MSIRYDEEELDILRKDFNDFVDAAVRRKRADANLLRNLDTSYARRSRSAPKQLHGRAQAKFDAYFKVI